MKVDKFKLNYKQIIAIITVAYLTILITILLFFFYSTEKTGQIGDTITGITGPFIGLLAAYLIFISFKEQYIANRIQINELKYERNFNFVINQITELRHLFSNDLKYNYKDGINAIDKYFDEVYQFYLKNKNSFDKYSEMSNKNEEDARFVALQNDAFNIDSNALNCSLFEITQIIIVVLDHINNNIEEKNRVQLLKLLYAYWDNRLSNSSFRVISSLFKDNELLKELFKYVFKTIENLEEVDSAFEKFELIS